MPPVATRRAEMSATTAAVLLCLALRALLPPWPSAGTGSMAESLIGFAVMLVLAFARMPIAFGMMIVGFFGFAFIVNWAASLAMFAQVAYDTGLHHEMTVVPLSIRMGAFVTRAGMDEEL